MIIWLLSQSQPMSVDSVTVSSAHAAFMAANVIVSQLGIWDGAIEVVARLYHELGKPFLLNPAPSRPLPKRIYENLRMLSSL